MKLRRGETQGDNPNGGDHFASGAGTVPAQGFDDFRPDQLGIRCVGGVMTAARIIKDLQGKFSPPTVKQHPLFGEDCCYFGLGTSGFGEDFP